MRIRSVEVCACVYSAFVIIIKVSYSGNGCAAGLALPGLGLAGLLAFSTFWNPVDASSSKRSSVSHRARV